MPVRSRRPVPADVEHRDLAERDAPRARERRAGREREVKKTVLEAASIDEGALEPIIIRSDSFPVKPMSVEEAVMQMDSRTCQAELALVNRDFDDSVRKVEAIPVSDGPMIHDMSLSERFAVVYDMPVTFDMEMAASGRGLPYSWKDGRPARLGVLPREGTGDEHDHPEHNNDANQTDGRSRRLPTT